MNLDNYIKIITFVSSIIALLNTFSKLGENTKLSQDYFEKVLSIYVKEYKNNTNLDSIEFIKRRFNISDYFIPSYIFYLVDKEKSDQLHKVLMIDYRKKFPNKMNGFARGINNAGILALGITAFIYYFFLAGAVISIVFLLICLIGNAIFSKTMDIKDIHNLEILILMIAVSIIMIFQFFYTIIKADDYNMKNKHIENIIQSKEEEFNKEKGYYIN